MRLLSERSEIWLADFTDRLHSRQTDINKAIDILDQIHSLFYSRATVKDDGALELPEELVINPIRQKMFTFLNGHLPLLNLIKDA